MKVYNCKLGRLGNAIFRYFASSLFCILYGASITYNQSECNAMMTDESFLEWSNNILLHRVIPHIGKDTSFMFYGFFQHDKIFYKYKKELINWIITHPNDLLYTDGNFENINYYNYNQTSYKVLHLLINPHVQKLYNVVVHLRLEDFINNNDVIHPISIKKILDELNEKDICFVVNKPKTELENKYIDYFKKYYNITIESNSVIEDYHIMKNARILVCSCSTLSWVAAFLSERVNLVYFPNYNNNRLHETFKQPIKNTILYEFKKCTKDELTDFLNNKNNKVDKYCSHDSKNEPITHKIIKYMDNIHNGFYIEAGAYDGVLQSNTLFLEEEYGWTGLLIEPSPNIFKQLQINRPNNININKCLVNSDWKQDTINGAFDNGPMSSVNNMRNIEKAELTNVPCITLEQQLDYLDITKIDFFSLDTEGYELQVLQGLNLQKYRPTLILIEIYESNKNEIFEFMMNNNYELLENITNYNKYDNPGWDGTHNDYLFKSKTT